jgi:hypothetical protein
MSQTAARFCTDALGSEHDIWFRDVAGTSADSSQQCGTPKPMGTIGLDVPTGSDPADASL